MYEGFVVYGAYARKDGRQHVVLYDGVKRVTLSYPKYLMECRLGRRLSDNEEVHHVDGDFANNAFDNLRVVERTNHRKLHANPTEIFTCPVCKKVFTLKGKYLSNYRSNIKRGKSKHGATCSKKCAGIASHYSKSLNSE